MSITNLCQDFNDFTFNQLESSIQEIQEKEKNLIEVKENENLKF